MRKLAAVCVVVTGLLAVLLAVSSVSYLTFAIQAFAAGGDAGAALTLVGGLLPSLVSLGVGVYLIRSRHTLAARWFDDEPLGSEVDPEALLKTGVLLVGLWLIASAAISMAGAIIGLVVGLVSQSQLSPDQLAMGGFGDPWSYVPLIGRGLIGLLAGQFLIRRSQSVTAWLLRPPAIPSLNSAAVEAPRCPACDAPYDPADYDAFNQRSVCTSCGEPLDIPRA